MVKFKPCVLYCPRCGWTNVKLPPRKRWFGRSWWLRCRADLEKWLYRSVFLSDGFPVDVLEGYAAMRDGIFLANGTRPGDRIVVEYRPNHDDTRKGNSRPIWLKCDSTGKPRSSMTYFHAWLHNEWRDTVFACDSPKTALRIMEAWWRAEGRMPDVTWSSRARPSRKCPKDVTFADRHVICAGSASLVKTFERRQIKVLAWLDTTGGLMPDELYMACRALEEKANDPGNNSDSVKLQVAARQQDRRELGHIIRQCDKEAKMRKVQAKDDSDDAIPPSVQRS